MKLKAYFWLVFLSVSFVLGGVYIAATMNRVVANLQDILLLRQMETQRKELLGRIREVQVDQMLKDTHHAVGQDVIAQHEAAVVESLHDCFLCHHPAPVVGKIKNLQEIFDVYQEKLNLVYSLKADDGRLPEAEKAAREEDRHLRDELNKLLWGTGGTVSARIELSRQEIFENRKLILAFVSIGPLLILLSSLYFFSRFPRAMTALSTAFRKVQDGDLDYRIEEDLDEEFRQLAKAFDGMNRSLREQGRQFETMQRRYHLLFENAGDAIFIMEGEGSDYGRILSANRAAAEMHGYSAAELCGMSIRDLDAPESFAKAPERLRRIQNGEWIKFEANHRKKDGAYFPVEASAGLLECDGHKYIMAFDRDVSGRAQADAALQRARQLVTVGEMAAGLAHEIKNPLAGIKVSIEVLSMDLALSQEDREVFQRVIQEVNRIEAMLKNLLAYARPAKPRFERLDLNALLTISVRHAELDLKNPGYYSSSGKVKEITFLTELAADLPQVAADPSQLQQVFLNLLWNAIEAIPESGTITVKDEWAQQGNEVRITFADTGKGFDERGLLRAFQPFYSTKSRSGLGLPISKRLVELHNGRIELANGEKEGTVLTVILPVNQPDGEAER